MTESVNSPDALITQEGLMECLRFGHGTLDDYMKESAERLHRITATLQYLATSISGPTLDVSSEKAILYPFFKNYLPNCLPYSISDRIKFDITVSGDHIPCVKFQCERDRLPLPDDSFGLVLFCDVIEHLCIDPMWTLLEINRVTRPGGYFLLTTPNAGGIVRALSVLCGGTPNTCNHYTPVNPYQRHNREFTLGEAALAMSCAGFKVKSMTTFEPMLNKETKMLLEYARNLGGFAIRPDNEFGPDIFMFGQKVDRRTLDDDLDKDIRWPKALYSEHACYRMRPEVFPIVSID